jgi:hypothetical protein
MSITVPTPAGCFGLPPHRRREAQELPQSGPSGWVAMSIPIAVAICCFLLTPERVFPYNVIGASEDYVLLIHSFVLRPVNPKPPKEL